jgi:hypothetical protein
MTFTTDFELGKEQTCRLDREAAPHQQTRSSLTNTSVTLGLRCGLTARLTGLLIVGRSVILTLT